MNKIRNIIIAVLMAHSAFSQNIPEKKYALVFNIGQQTDAIAIDAGALQTIQNTPFKPRIELGVERTWSEGKTVRWHQDLKLTFVNNPYVERVYGIGTDLGAEFKILKRILVTPRIGVHYNYAKSTDVQYVYEGGKWVTTPNFFAPTNRILLKGGIDLGYRINYRYDVFVNGQYSINLPHLKNVVDINLNQAVSVGIRYSIF